MVASVVLSSSTRIMTSEWVKRLEDEQGVRFKMKGAAETDMS